MVNGPAQLHAVITPIGKRLLQTTLQTSLCRTLPFAINLSKMKWVILLTEKHSRVLAMKEKTFVAAGFLSWVLLLFPPFLSRFSDISLLSQKA